MKRCGLLIGALVLAAVTVQARLGETDEQLAKRYGKPVIEPYRVEYIYRNYGDTQARYEKDDVSIFVVLKDKQCQLETVAKKDTTGRLSRTEIKAFLDANAGGSAWSPARGPGEVTTWERDDGTARAALTADGKALTVKITQGGAKGF